MTEWKPAIGERFIWQDQAVLTCTNRVFDPATGKRCLTGTNITGSGYLDGHLLDFELCRPYWEPQPGDRAYLAVTWLEPRFSYGKEGKCLGYRVDNDGLRLARLLFDDGSRWDCQPIWLLPAGGEP